MNNAPNESEKNEITPTPDRIPESVPVTSGASYAVPPTAAKKPRAFEGYEVAFAWVTLLLGYLFCRVWPAEDHPFGALLFTLVLYGCGAVFLIRRKAAISGGPMLIALSSILLSLSFFFSSNAVIHICTFLWIIVAYIYWIYCACGNAIAPLGDVTFNDVLKAVFVMPFESLGAFFRAAFGGVSENGKKVGKSVLWIAVGLLLAVIPTKIVFSLLSYDEKFNSLVDRLLAFDLSEVWSHLGSLVLAVPIAVIGFAYLISSSDNVLRDRITADGCRRSAAAVRILPQLLVYFAILPMLAVYVLFFISQADYYLAALGGSLPEGVVSRSQYAREGFFELCTVSGINAAALLGMSLFTKRSGNGTPGVWQRVFAAVISVFTLVLIATAAAKMILYIGLLGLTPKRVYTMWFMALLALAFLYALIRQIVPKFNFAAAFVVTFVLLFACISVFNVDGWIAKYNADRYIDGTLEEYDVDAMADLGDSALPQMIRVADYMVSSGRVVPNGIDLREAVNAREKSLYDLRKKQSEWMQVIASGGQENRDVRQYVDLLARIAEWNYLNESWSDSIFTMTLPKLRAEAALTEALGGDGGTK